MKLSRLLACIAALLISSPALAGICLEDDPERDNLLEQDRLGGLSLLASAIEERGVPVGESCDVTWKIVHVKLGRSVTVSATNGSQVYKMTAEVLEDLPRVYSQLAHGMVTGEPLNQAMDRSNVTRAQAEGRRAKSDYLATVMFGGTAYPPVGGIVAPTFSGGFRVELDRWAIDANGKMALPVGEALNGDYLVGIHGHLNAIRFIDPLANDSWFYGGGLGYGAVGWEKGSDAGEGYGFEARGIAGYEMFRASTMRFFVQMDLIAPLYSIDADYWSPTIGLSIGLGYKPNPRSVPWWTILF
jgi:hypothetical protein